VIWRNTPSFETLQGDPNFERIVKASKAVQERKVPKNELVLYLHLLQNYSDTSPLLFALRRNETTAQDTMPFWQGSISQGWVLALPQSNQGLYRGAYVSNDLAAAFANLKEHIDQLQAKLTYDEKRAIIASHSLGNLVAIQMSLTGFLSVSGFIAIGPVIPFLDDREKLVPMLIQARVRNLREYLIVGDKDDHYYVEGSQVFFEILQSVGVKCKLEIVPGAAHDYLPVYDAALVRALRFVGGEKENLLTFLSV
jgi:predicted esterase